MPVLSTEHQQLLNQNLLKKAGLKLFIVQAQPLLPPGFPESLTPSPEKISRIPSAGGGEGVDFFWNNPMLIAPIVLKGLRRVLVLRSKGTVNGGKPSWVRKTLWLPHFFGRHVSISRNSLMLSYQKNS